MKRTQSTKTSIDADGNEVKEWDGPEAPGIRTHDHSDENAINERLFGKTSRTNTSSTRIHTDADGNKVESYSGEGDGPGIRTHDYSDEAAINERLFGKSAPNPKRTNSNTYTYKNADGDQETVHAGEEAPALRTHDHSNEDEINERLFGKGAVRSH